eukprot:scaffold3665_cov244-Pinguiococcus_pyrenoidosus.AAC.1
MTTDSGRVTYEGCGLHGVELKRLKKVVNDILKKQHPVGLASVHNGVSNYCHEHSPRFREAPARKMLRSLSQEEVVAVARAHDCASLDADLLLDSIREQASRGCPIALAGGWPFYSVKNCQAGRDLLMQKKTDLCKLAKDLGIASASFSKPVLAFKILFAQKKII